MRSREFYKRVQGWLGGLFLIASFAFVLMVFSMSSVLADPHFHLMYEQQQQQQLSGAMPSPRTAQVQANNRAGGAVRPSAGTGVRGATGNVQSRTQPAAVAVGQQQPDQGRAAVIQGVVAAEEDSTAVSRAAPAAVSRGMTARTAVTPGAQRAPAAQATQARGVAQRASPVTNRTTDAAQRAVRARAATTGAVRSTADRGVVARAGVQPATQARISMAGAAMARGGTSGLRTTWPQQWNNLIDQSTGMISSAVYADCMQSYYACMDEICTVRNPGQRRCACAGRVRTFSEVESQLQLAREELLRVSGELSLLIATRGESIHHAFTLTDAEKSLNCVAYRDELQKRRGQANSDTNRHDMRDWCEGRLIPGTDGTWNCGPVINLQCSDIFGGTGGANSVDWMSILNGSDSSILAALNVYASAIDDVNSIRRQNDADLLSNLFNLNTMFGGGGSGGTSIAGLQTAAASDKLAETWGYDLFKFAHNNVCSRVLDSCFNGIYEACGPTDCGTGHAGGCNLNSQLRLDSKGDNIIFGTRGSSNITSASGAACFGYANTLDPYADFRRPVADARLSILHRYVLDSNADCDAYGEELRTQATNMSYQRIAATQMLQQKRLEFAQEREANATKRLTDAKSNFRTCVNEILTCYTTQIRLDQPGQSRADNPWGVNMIRNHCAQPSQISACYEEMICDQDARAVIDVPDEQLNYCDPLLTGPVDGRISPCHNIVRLVDILSGVSGVTSVPEVLPHNPLSHLKREHCLRSMPGVFDTGANPSGIRNLEAWWNRAVLGL